VTLIHTQKTGRAPITVKYTTQHTQSVHPPKKNTKKQQQNTHTHIQKHNKKGEKNMRDIIPGSSDHEIVATTPAQTEQIKRNGEY